MDLNKYSEFVESVTSNESNNFSDFKNKLEILNQKDKIKIQLLLTAGIGLSSETGEFNEIIKKIIFQGKPLNEDNIFHMKRELGDIIWYWINACRSLNLDPNEVIQENVNKLLTRYPNKKFEDFFSENRKINDL
jgi:NTP pyrophosphatase (non-canonical NTP hydrolase)